MATQTRKTHARRHTQAMTDWFTRALQALLLLLVFCQAQAANDKGLLLEASKEGRTVYLLGSIHLADKSFYPLRPAIEEAYKDSQALVVEADVIAMESDLALQQQVMLESLYPPGQKLKDHIPEDVYRQLQDWLHKRQLPEEHFNRLRPAIAMITLSLIEMQARGLDPKAGIDRHFLNQAHRNDKTTLELESVLGQLRMLNSLERPELYLQQTLAQLGEMDSFVPRMTEAWKSGDQSRLHELVIKESLQQYPELAQLFDLLFYQRNVEMAEKIRHFSRQHKKLFVVVGAGHLVGEKSVPYYLQAAGFDIKQI
ncbi:TraB/GumN family protein [Microbulbifer bruguierae]|uniref:TraB/GumN family protein n=1 Tax=Microbulbifer bruguierae TaxID=3029061 RepID=A0ABY8NFA0_9GAMM|nr:TraB/GumN family protein [Microbulbifer bruguierae]WGL16762.1 TraB/GumN family protein [Microbulbifer bruguierae]